MQNIILLNCQYYLTIIDFFFLIYDFSCFFFFHFAFFSNMYQFQWTVLNEWVKYYCVAAVVFATIHDTTFHEEYRGAATRYIFYIFLCDAFCDNCFPTVLMIIDFKCIHIFYCVCVCISSTIIVVVLHTINSKGWFLIHYMTFLLFIKLTALCAQICRFVQWANLHEQIYIYKHIDDGEYQTVYDKIIFIYYYSFFFS